MTVVSVMEEAARAAENAFREGSETAARAAFKSVLKESGGTAFDAASNAIEGAWADGTKNIFEKIKDAVNSNEPFEFVVFDPISKLVKRVDGEILIKPRAESSFECSIEQIQRRLEPIPREPSGKGEAGEENPRLESEHTTPGEIVKSFSDFVKEAGSEVYGIAEGNEVALDTLTKTIESNAKGALETVVKGLEKAVEDGLEDLPDVPTTEGEMLENLKKTKEELNKKNKKNADAFEKTKTDLEKLEEQRDTIGEDEFQKQRKKIIEDNLLDNGVKKSKIQKAGETAMELAKKAGKGTYAFVSCVFGKLLWFAAAVAAYDIYELIDNHRKAMSGCWLRVSNGETYKIAVLSCDDYVSAYTADGYAGGLAPAGGLEDWSFDLSKGGLYWSKTTPARAVNDWILCPVNNTGVDDSVALKSDADMPFDFYCQDGEPNDYCGSDTTKQCEIASADDDLGVIFTIGEVDYYISKPFASDSVNPNMCEADEADENGDKSYTYRTISMTDQCVLQHIVESLKNGTAVSNGQDCDSDNGLLKNSNGCLALCNSVNFKIPSMETATTTLLFDVTCVSASFLDAANDIIPGGIDVGGLMDDIIYYLKIALIIFIGLWLLIFLGKILINKISK